MIAGMLYGLDVPGSPLVTRDVRLRLKGIVAGYTSVAG
jgi:hypothetical protein